LLTHLGVRSRRCSVRRLALDAHAPGWRSVVGDRFRIALAPTQARAV
jgi:hypothetical protein